MSSLALACRLGAGSTPTLPRRVRSILRKYPSMLLMPGPSGLQVFGFQPGNYRESTGQNLAAADQQVGLAVDAAQSPGPEVWTYGSPFVCGNVAAYGAIAGAYGIAPVELGKSYLVQMSVSNLSANGLSVQIGTITPFVFLAGEVSQKSAIVTGITAKTLVIKEGATAGGSAGATVTISVRELPGIHASQATSGYQPYLRQVPKTLGPELVVNGAFDSGIAGWINASNTGGAISWNSSSAALNVTNTSGTARARQNVTVTTGKKYAITLTTSARAGSSLYLGSAEGTTDLSSGATVVGQQSIVVTAITPTLSVTIAEFATGTTTVDNISVREVLEWTYAWQFDGADDRLSLSSLPLASGDDFYQAFALRCATSGANKTFADLLTNPTTGTRLGCLRINGANALQVVHANDAGGVVTTAGRTVTDGQQLVVEALRVGASHTVFADGAVDIQTALAGNYTTTHATIGARGAGTSEPFLGFLYATFALKGAPSDGERATIRKFMAQLQGRSL